MASASVRMAGVTAVVAGVVAVVAMYASTDRVLDVRASAGSLEARRGEVLGREVNARVVELGEISDAKTHRERTFLSPAWATAAASIESWMKDAGLEVWYVRGQDPSERK